MAECQVSIMEGQGQCDLKKKEIADLHSHINESKSDRTIFPALESSMCDKSKSLIVIYRVLLKVYSISNCLPPLNPSH